MAPEHHIQMAKTLEVEPMEEKTVKEESSGKSVSLLRPGTISVAAQKL